MLEVESIAKKFVAEEYFTTGEWLNIPGQGFSYYDNVEIISSKLTISNEECATVKVVCTIEVKIDREGETEEDEEQREIEVYLENHDGEWIVDNANE